MFRWTTAGESHGQSLIALIEGMPAGVALTSQDIRSALARRRLGYGRGARQKFERDVLRVLSGVRHGYTIGSPIALEVANSEWPKWETVMSADPVDPTDLLIDAGTGDEREIARNRKLTRPRPGHADLVGMNKYRFDEARPVLERASARETAARVAAGAVAAALNEQAAGIKVISRVVQIGNVKDESPFTEHFDISQAQALDISPVRCLNPHIEKEMMGEIDNARKAGDTLGGVAEIIAFGVPEGLGSYTSAFDRFDAHLAAAMMSIQSVKGVEIGDGFQTAGRRGSQAHDEIFVGNGGLYRETNRAGGIEGGMTNGLPVRVRVAFKPISTVPHALRTVDVATGESATALHQRSDTTAVVPGAVVAEAMMQLVIAEFLLSTHAGDSLEALRSSIVAQNTSISEMRK